MQDNKVKILPLSHFIPAPLQQTCTHSHFFFSFSTLLQECNHNIKVSSCFTGGNAEVK